MLPVILRLGPITIHSFGFMLAVGFLLIAWLAAREFARRGYHPDIAGSAVLAAMIGGVLGAKLYYLIDHFPETRADPLGSIFSGAGLTYYGGLIGGALGVIWITVRNRIPLRIMADIGGPLIALGYGVGRIGCFLNGDDYGKPSSLPWAMTFPKGTPPTTVPVQPTQLYEVAASLAFFAFLWANRRRYQDRPGFLMGIYLVLAGTERFLVEFVRTNVPVALGLTVAQLISIGVFAIGVVLLANSPRRSEQPPAAARP